MLWVGHVARMVRRKIHMKHWWYSKKERNY
jgi:hypothetical protein